MGLGGRLGPWKRKGKGGKSGRERGWAVRARLQRWTVQPPLAIASKKAAFSTVLTPLDRPLRAVPRARPRQCCNGLCGARSDGAGGDTSAAAGAKTPTGRPQSQSRPPASSRSSHGEARAPPSGWVATHTGSGHPRRLVCGVRGGRPAVTTRAVSLSKEFNHEMCLAQEKIGMASPLSGPLRKRLPRPSVLSHLPPHPSPPRTVGHYTLQLSRPTTGLDTTIAAGATHAGQVLLPAPMARSYLVV